VFLVYIKPMEQMTIQGLELEQVSGVCFKLMTKGATFVARESCGDEIGPWVVVLTGGY
jgi:hypothetical protein